MPGNGEYERLLALIREAMDKLREAYDLALKSGIPFVALPIKTMIMPILHELTAQLDGYRNDFIASPELELWPRLGSYPGGTYDFEVKRVKWEEV